MNNITMTESFSEEAFNAFNMPTQDTTDVQDSAESNRVVSHNNSQEISEEVEENEDETKVTDDSTDSYNSDESDESDDSDTDETSDIKEERKESRANKRIRELNERTKAAEQRAKLLEQELASFKGDRHDDKPINPNDYETFEDYISAVTEYKANQLLQKREEERITKQRDAAIREYQEAVFTTFNDRVNDYSKVQPRIAEAVSHVEQYAESMPQGVVEAMLTDENSAPIMWEVANNVDLLTQLIKGNPIESIRMIAKLSARFESNTPRQQRAEIKPLNAVGGVVSTERPGREVEAPRLPTARVQKSRGIEGMSTDEIVRRRDLKRPW